MTMKTYATLLCILASFAIALTANAQSAITNGFDWQAMPSEPDFEIYNHRYLQVADDVVYFVGSTEDRIFNLADSWLFSYDTTNDAWEQVVNLSEGSGLDLIYATYMIDDNLFLGGRFRIEAGNWRPAVVVYNLEEDSFEEIIRYNVITSNNAGVENFFEADNGILYFVGFFSNNDGNNLGAINLENLEVETLSARRATSGIYHDGNLYLTGRFNVDGTAYGLAKIDAGTGEEEYLGAMSNPAPGQAGENLLLLDDSIFVVGNFPNMGGTTLGDIVEYSLSNQSWSRPINGSVGTITEITTFNGDIYIGGNFTTFGGEPIGRIATIDFENETLLPLSSGVNARVRGIQQGGDDLIVVGDFTEAGGKDLVGIARWTEDGEPVSLNPDSNEIPNIAILEQNYPNPFNPITQIRFTLPEAQPVQLDIFNIQGQRVQSVLNGIHSAGSHTVTVNAANLSSGLYVYRLTTPTQVLSKTMMIVK